MNTSRNESVLVHLAGKVVGPCPVKDLRRLKGFTVQTLISFPDSGKWAPAFRVLNINSYEPPVAVTYQSPHVTLDWNPPSSSSAAAFDWKAPPSAGSWSDRWFRRLAIFNTLLVIGGIAAWCYAPTRQALQKEYRFVAREERKPMEQLFTRWILPKIRAQPTLQSLFNELAEGGYVRPHASY